MGKRNDLIVSVQLKPDEIAILNEYRSVTGKTISDVLKEIICPVLASMQEQKRITLARLWADSE